MRFVFLSYGSNPGFKNPDDWLNRIRGYTGILETLARTNEVMSIEQIDYSGIFHNNGVAYHFLKFGKRQLKFPAALHRYVKKLNPDIVFVHGMHYPLQVLQLGLSLGNSAKIILQNHAEKPGRRSKRILQKLADRFVSRYLFTSIEMGEEWVTANIIRDRKKICEVMEASSVFHPISRSEARNFTATAGNPTYLWVGRLDSNKDPLTVVKAFLKFHEVNSAASLYMIYHTEELMGSIKKLLENAGSNAGSVVLVGKVKHDDMGYWFNSADFIISGSHYEGSGVAVCEAMSCGCIPILTNILSFRKISNGNCGILYQAGNENELLSALHASVKMDLDNERHKVLAQFKSSLSFDSIAKTIQEITGSL